MNNLFNTLTIAALYLFIFPVNSQDLSILENLEGILENVDSSSSNFTIGADTENFNSLTKNEYSNVVSQLQSVSDSSEDEEVLSEANLDEAETVLALTNDGKVTP